jgi:hypothetical protein
MRSPDRTLDRILEAFAEAVAAGEFEKAEGWLAVARWAQGAREISSPLPSAESNAVLGRKT